jgi:hypothetical protein
MSRDEEIKNLQLFDRRTVERNIKKGLISRKDYDKFLKGLADVTDRVAPMEERPIDIAGVEDEGREQDMPAPAMTASSEDDEDDTAN